MNTVYINRAECRSTGYHSRFPSILDSIGIIWKRKENTTQNQYDYRSLFHCNSFLGPICIILTTFSQSILSLDNYFIVKMITEKWPFWSFVEYKLIIVLYKVHIFHYFKNQYQKLNAILPKTFQKNKNKTNKQTLHWSLLLAVFMPKEFFIPMPVSSKYNSDLERCHSKLCKGLWGILKSSSGPEYILTVPRPSYAPVIMPKNMGNEDHLLHTMSSLGS